MNLVLFNNHGRVEYQSGKSFKKQRIETEKKWR